MRRTILGVCILAVALGSSCLAQQPWRMGDTTFTIGGSGSSDDSLDNTVFGFEGSLGWFLADNWELSVRQGFSWADQPGSDNDWDASTRLAIDLHWGQDAVRPFIGANAGYIYGDRVSDTFIFGPEAGVRWFVNNTTYLQIMAEYQIFERDQSLGDLFDDGRFLYTVAMGVRF